MPRYRNANTGQVVDLRKRSHRLERLANWEQLEDEVEEADFEPADEAIAESEGSVEDALNAATVPQLRELAAERGLSTAGNKPDLVDRLAAAVMAEVALDAEESS